MPADFLKTGALSIPRRNGHVGKVRPPIVTAGPSGIDCAMQAESLGILVSLWARLVSVQREISADLALMLNAFAETRDWWTLAGFLPFGIASGAAHALTPGHSKTVLSLFVAGSGASLSRGVGTALILSATHISISVLVIVLALPVVSLAFGEVGRARILEDLSRGLIALIGLWLLIAAIRGQAAHGHHEDAAFGVVAGLIPCPLTLFVMTFSSARGAPEAGLAFALWRGPDRAQRGDGDGPLRTHRRDLGDHQRVRRGGGADGGRAPGPGLAPGVPARPDRGAAGADAGGRHRRADGARNLAGMAVAGLLVGLGTALGSGRTSGHGVCGWRGWRAARSWRS